MDQKLMPMVHGLHLCLNTTIVMHSSMPIHLQVHFMSHLCWFFKNVNYTQIVHPWALVIGIIQVQWQCNSPIIGIMEDFMERNGMPFWQDDFWAFTCPGRRWSWWSTNLVELPTIFLPLERHGSYGSLEAIPPCPMHGKMGTRRMSHLRESMN